MIEDFAQYKPKDYWKQIVYENVPLDSLITQRCGCVLKVAKGSNWNYPTFYPIHLCSDKYSCQLRHRKLGLEMWNFYDEFKDIDMEATFGITDEEANELLRQWEIRNY